MRNNENRKFFNMERHFFSMITKFSADKLTSSVAMEQPINIENFVELSGSSGFTCVYAGNSFRTVTVHPEKKSVLPLDNTIKTITFDFFKNNGDFICQVILFISTEQDQKESRTSTKMSIDLLEKNIHTLIKPILDDYIAGIRDDLETRFQDKFNAQITSKISLFQSITCVLTTVKPENIKNTTLSLPINCDVFLEDEKVSFKALRSGTDQCYVATKDKLFHYKKGKQDTFVRQEIKLTETSFLKLREDLLKLKNGQSLDGFFPQSKDNRSLQTVLIVLPEKYQPVNSVANNNWEKSAYTTLVINRGRHLVSIIDSKGSSTKLSELFTIKHLQLNEIVQIESQPGLLNIDTQEIKVNKENKENKYERPLHFQTMRERLCTQAEAMRREAYGYWEAPTAKKWLFLISRLWAFQDRLESGDLQQPEDPTYELLRTASLTYFWPLTKALENVQTLEEDAKEISEDDLVEIKKQWQEASTTENKSQPLTLTWQQAFKKQHRRAPIKIGGEVRVLAVMPINHTHKLRNFTALRILPEFSTQLKCLEHHFLKGLFIENRIILSLMPPTPETRSTLDAIREFYCYSASQPLAKLTVLYSPRYIEEPGWQKDMQEVRDQVLKSLAEQIFTNLDKFYSGVTENLREFISNILSRNPFKGVKANLLFCLFVPSETTTHRYLIGVGNCMALTFEHNAFDSHVISALYDSEKDVPVLLNSLNRPDDPVKLISGSSIRQSESIQIVDITAPEAEILLCSGRLIGPDLLEENKEAITSKFKFRNYGLNLGKLLSENESKNDKLIDQVTQALQINRRKFLDIIENPNMISAWKKIEHRLRNRNPPLPDEDPIEQNIDLAVMNIDNCGSANELIMKFNSLKLKIVTEESRLSPDESKMIQNLWEIAIIETQGLTKSLMPPSWYHIRGRYFIYFEGIKDLMAVFSPDINFKSFSLLQHINALADQYFLPLQQAGKKEQLLEIKAFNHAISSVDTDEKIYTLIYHKLNFIDEQGSLEPGFWMDLAKVLIFMFINVDSNINCTLDPEDFVLSQLLSALAKKIKSYQPPSSVTTTGSLSSFAYSLTRRNSTDEDDKNVSSQHLSLHGRG